MDKKTVARKIFYFPLTKIIAGLFVVGGIVGVAGMLTAKALALTTLEKDFQNLIGGVFVALLSVVLYTYLYKAYEKRKITEFSKNGIVRYLANGIALGAVLQSLIILFIFLMGGFSFISLNPILYIVPSFTMAFFSAVFEETVSRGILFRITEEKLGSYFALIISSLIFGALHLFNPNVSVPGILLTILAGLLLAAAYMYTRNLWFPIGIHFAWNFTLAGIFGANVSGLEMSKTLLTTDIEGPVWLTGGEFGPEASIQANVICLVATLLLLVLCHKHGKVIKPWWKKSGDPGSIPLEPS